MVFSTWTVVPNTHKNVGCILPSIAKTLGITIGTVGQDSLAGMPLIEALCSTLNHSYKYNPWRMYCSHGGMHPPSVNPVGPHLLFLEWWETEYGGKRKYVDLHLMALNVLPRQGPSLETFFTMTTDGVLRQICNGRGTTKAIQETGLQGI